MSENHAQEIGALQANVKNAKDDIVRLSHSNARRKQENIDAALKQNSIQHTVEKTNTITTGVAESMEELKQSMDEVKTSMANMDGRITILEERAFDWPKFLSGVVSKKGLLVIFMVCITIIILTLARNAPETLPQFFDLIKASK